MLFLLRAIYSLIVLLCSIDGTICKETARAYRVGGVGRGKVVTGERPVCYYPGCSIKPNTGADCIAVKAKDVFGTV